MSSAGSDLPRRLAVAAVGIPFGTWIIYLGGWPLVLVLAVVAALGAHEFFGLVSSREVDAVPEVGVVLAGGLVLLPAFGPTMLEFAPRAWVTVVLATLGVLAWVVRARGVEGAPLEAAAITMAGALYTGATLAFAPLIRHLPEIEGPAIVPPNPWEGTALLFFPLFVTWVGDACAYFGGRAWGRRPLAPTISPKKTVEGAVAGLLGAIASAILFSALVLQNHAVFGVPVAVAAIMGLVLGVAGQIGDLAESVFKRAAGVKDSGTLLPGHGGVLDRFDAVFFTVPLAYLLYRAWAYVV